MAIWIMLKPTVSRRSALGLRRGDRRMHLDPRILCRCHKSEINMSVLRKDKSLPFPGGLPGPP